MSFDAMSTPDLVIRFKRHPDASASLSCTRRDGSVTWQRQRGSLGVVFPPHDLTHFAVETTLGFGQGFYGLLADGWEIADFAAPWSRGPIPEQAVVVEQIVGFFDAERRQGTRWSAEEFAQHADTYRASREASRHTASPCPPALSEVEIGEVRACRDALLAQWNALLAGEEMRLEFRRRAAPRRGGLTNSIGAGQSHGA